MRTAAVAFGASVIVAAALTPSVRAAGRRWGALDHASSARKIHAQPTPRIGGIAIVLAFYAPLVALIFANSDVGRQFYSEPRKALALFVGGLIIATLGLVDDLRGTNPRTKFVVQFAVAGLVYALGGRITAIANPFGHDLVLGWLSLPFTMLWIAGVINAMNLIDGLDGLAGGVALIAVGTLFALSAFRGDTMMVLFTATLAGAVLGFLFYNFNPASIFMGDTGSMFLGFVLATASIQTGNKSSTAVAIALPIVALGVPIVDTLLAMLRRTARGLPMFSADRGHIHHRLLARGLSHRQAVLVLYGASIVLAGVALMLSFSSSSQARYLLLALAAVAYLALRGLGFFSLRNVPNMLEARKKNLCTRREIRRIASALRMVEKIEDVWAAVLMAGRAVNADAVALRLPGYGPRPDDWADGFADPGLELFRVQYELISESAGVARIELGWADGRTALERDTEIAIEILCEHMSEALERVHSRSRLDENLAAVVNLRR